MVFVKGEALCIFLKRLVYPCRLSGPHVKVWTKGSAPIMHDIKLSTKYYLRELGFLMRNMNQNWLSRRNLELFAEVIHTKGVPLDNCWWFVHGATRPVRRPGQNQRLLSNGRKRYHCIKFQSVVAPSGPIANLFGPVEGKRHDSDMLVDSVLLNQLQQHSFDTGGGPLCIYGDPAYPLRIHLESGFRGANITREEEL